MRYASNNEVLASAQRSAGGGVKYSNVVNAKSYEFAMISAYITAKTGSPTIQFTLLCSPVDPSKDDSKWAAVYGENPVAPTGAMSLRGQPQTAFTGWLKISYNITGTGSITFSANIEVK